MEDISDAVKDKFHAQMKCMEVHLEGASLYIKTKQSMLQ